MASELSNKHIHTPWDLHRWDDSWTWRQIKNFIISHLTIPCQVLYNKYHIQFLLRLDEMTSKCACGHYLKGGKELQEGKEGNREKEGREVEAGREKRARKQAGKHRSVKTRDSYRALPWATIFLLAFNTRYVYF